MQRVNNKKCIQRLSQRSLATARGRNSIAIIAIALTAMLFTSLFTIVLSMNASFEEQNFRQVGGSFHGVFKNITKEQEEQFKSHALIQKAGYRRILGMPQKEPFHKSHVEIAYAEKACADAMFCVPEKGRLPKENTLEAATDTRVLALLGIEPELGKEFTVTYVLGDNKTELTQTFILCGYWEYDEAVTASHIITAESYVDEVLRDYVPAGSYDTTGKIDLDVNFKTSFSIEKDLKQVLSDFGYQNDDRGAENYIALGVNWGYTGAQYADSEDMVTWMAMAAAMLLIIFTGYLIIYNIFRISVTGDIQFYGLLKTIGTTGKQIRAIIRRQVLWLSAIGIPLGLFTGWFCGTVLTPVVMSIMTSDTTVISAHPLIFIAAALFSLITVFISCYRPGKLAASVSPVEAVRYTEGTSGKKKEKKSEGGAKVYRMAFSNLGRSRVKTMLIVISLSLAVLLLNLTYTFTNGFDMDKYLEKLTCVDFILGSADYFQVNKQFRNEENALPQEAAEAVRKQKGITQNGKIYGQTTQVLQSIPKDFYMNSWRGTISEESYKELEKSLEADEKGMIDTQTYLYGMEEFPRALLTTLEGDIEKLADSSGNYIAAVVREDDYGNPYEDSAHAQVGDEVKIMYIEEMKYVDNRTGEPAGEDTPEMNMKAIPVKYHEKIYTVAARVIVPMQIGYRFYGSEQYVLSSEEFIKETGTENIMTCLYNTTDEDNETINAFLEEYTQKIDPSCDYESKQMKAEEFKEFRNMFLLMGGALSFIIGLIGVLNFINGIVTSIISRKREFAVLEAVGMTGKQLKTMLIIEGMSYGGMAIVLALVLNCLAAPFLSDVLMDMFWFYSYQFTVLPILLILPVFLALGVCLPLLAYHFMRRQSVVERIRQAEMR